MRNLFLVPFLLLTACSSGGFFSSTSALEVHSMGLDRAVLRSDCSTIVCTQGFANEGDIWMTDIPMDDLVSGDFDTGQIIHLQLLWTPVAGKTPLQPTSTNLAIKQYIISNGAVGVYGGGGFCWPTGAPEKGISLYIEEANLSLQNSNGNFNDLLSPASITGRVQSTPNNTIARQIANAALLVSP